MEHLACRRDQSNACLARVYISSEKFATKVGEGVAGETAGGETWVN